MGIQSLNSLGGVKIDKTDLIPILANAMITTTPIYQTLLNISGKGFIDTAIIGGGTNGVLLKITVDAEVTYEVGGANGGAWHGGVAKRAWGQGAFYFPDPGNLAQALTAQTPYYAYPRISPGSIAASAHNISTLFDSIYFKNSLLIEARVPTGMPNNSSNYLIIGGYK